MRRTRLIWQLYPSYLILIVLALLGIAWYTSTTLDAFHERQTGLDLEARALLVSRLMVEPLRKRDLAGVGSLSKSLSRFARARITVILPSGKVVGDSEKDPSQMEPHGDRPEIRQALTTGQGASIRFSTTLQRNMMYVAVAVRGEGGAMAVVRASMPLTAVEAAQGRLRWRIAIAGILIALAAAAIGLYVAHRISLPLRRMQQAAERFAQGDFSHKLPVPDSEEMRRVAEAMNTMADQLDDRIRAIDRQRAELAALLASMVEGFLAVDGEERIISLNRAAGELLGLDPGSVRGKSLHEVVRNPDLRRVIGQILHRRETVETEIALHTDQERALDTHATVLRDAQGGEIGAVVVMHDITEVRKLETIRRDFVANVSHELKTPVTAIKGFVETLIDGGAADSEDSSRFLSIIRKHADRLQAIIEDLLTLSRVELESGREGIALEPTRLKPILESARQICEVKAAEKSIAVTVDCDAGLRVDMSPRLIEQAVVNLVDNAIKYSPENSSVEIEAVAREADAVIRVTDHGCGIPEEHVPRLFERFYRVDKARSRDLGGTGLGLAIVRHIVRAHTGSVSVASKPDEGSVFSIRLPLEQNFNQS